MSAFHYFKNHYELKYEEAEEYVKMVKDKIKEFNEKWRK